MQRSPKRRLSPTTTRSQGTNCKNKIANVKKKSLECLRNSLGHMPQRKMQRPTLWSMIGLSLLVAMIPLRKCTQSV